MADDSKVALSAERETILTYTDVELLEIYRAVGELARACGNPAVYADGDKTVESETIRYGAARLAEERALRDEIIERELARSSERVTCDASGIYVASRVKQAEVWKSYRARGWKINASWIDEAGEGETADFGELWQRIRDEIARSHCLVFYAAGPEDFPFKGALVEVGMALAMGKPVIAALPNVSLDGRTMRPVGSWLLDGNVIRCETLDEAMEVARGADLLCKTGTRSATADTCWKCRRLFTPGRFTCQESPCGAIVDRDGNVTAKIATADSRREDHD